MYQIVLIICRQSYSSTIACLLYIYLSLRLSPYLYYNKLIFTVTSSVLKRYLDYSTIIILLLTTISYLYKAISLAIITNILDTSGLSRKFNPLRLRYRIALGRRISDRVVRFGLGITSLGVVLYRAAYVCTSRYQVSLRSNCLYALQAYTSSGLLKNLLI